MRGRGELTCGYQPIGRQNWFIWANQGHGIICPWHLYWPGHPPFLPGSENYTSLQNLTSSPKILDTILTKSPSISTIYFVHLRYHFMCCWSHYSRLKQDKNSCHQWKKTWFVGFVTHKKNNYKQVYWVKNYQSLKILDAQKILLLCREDKAKLSLNCMSHLVLLWLSALFMADTIVDQYFNGYIDIATFIFGSRFKSKLLESNRRLLIW